MSYMNTRRKQGRKGTRNRPPADTTVKVRREILDEIDLMIQFPRMPLGLKIESMVKELKMYRKNSVGHNPNYSLQGQQTLVTVNRVYSDNNINLINDNAVGLGETDEQYQAEERRRWIQASKEVEQDPEQEGIHEEQENDRILEDDESVYQEDDSDIKDDE